MPDDQTWLRFEYSDDKSNKFWEIRADGAAYVVRYGKIGSKGREQRKELDSETACADMVQRKIEEKKRKGYRSMAPAASRLWQVVEARDEAGALEQIAEGADPNESRDGVCVLERALEQRCNGIAVALIDAGADLHALSSGALNPVWAVQTGRPEIVRAFLDAGAEPNVQCAMGSPLRLAARNGLAEIVTILIDAGADLELGGVVSLPLFDAIEQGHAECAELLLAAGASTDPARNGGRSVVTLATKAGTAGVLRTLVEVGADLEHQESFEILASPSFTEPGMDEGEGFLAALERGVADLVSLARSNDVSASYEGATPLIVAAGEGYLDCVEILIEAGVELERLDERGRSAIEHARDRGHAEIVARLESAGARPNAVVPATQRLLLAAEAGDLAELEPVITEGVDVETKEARDAQLGRTALMLAAGGGHAELVDALLAAGADPNRRDDHGEQSPPRPGAFWMRDDSRGRTALHLAAEGGHGPVVERLLAAGADPACVDLEKDTPLLLAAGVGDTASVRALLAAGADPNQRGANRCTPLGASLSDGGEAAAALLIEAGAKVDIKDGYGDTPLSIAALLDLGDVVEKLLAAGANPTLANRGGERPSQQPSNPELAERLREAERTWRAEGRSAPEPVDEEEERAKAARARTPEVVAPSVADLRKTYDHEAVLSRLQSDAESGSFRTLVADVAERCGGEPDDQRASVGGYVVGVASDRLDEEGLAELQAAMLARGGFVCACSRDIAGGSLRRLLVLPTTDRYDALVVFGTNGCNEDKTAEDILRWLMQREQIHPFTLLCVESDTLSGRFEGEIADPEELAQSMYDLCSDIVEQGVESVEALAQVLAETRRLYFWWD